MFSPLRKFAAATAALVICSSPTLAAAAPTPMQPVNPLVAVSVFGTQASAQAVCTQAASAASTAGAALAAQGQAGCVLPATDVPPPVVEGAPPPPSDTGISGVGWLLIGLDSLLALAGIYTLFDDDDDDDDEALSPA